MKQPPQAAAVATQALFQRAIEHHQAGHLPEAEALYSQVLRALPAHADALHLLGVIALQQGRFDAAVERIEQAIRVRPADNFYCNLGNALREQGRHGEAVASYRQALALNAGLPEAWSNLGHALLVQGELEEAASSCRQAIALRPDFTAAHLNLGNALLQQARLDEAAACYRQALRLMPGLALAHAHLGDVLAMQGLPGPAAESYGRAQAIGMDSAELHRKMGRAFRQLGRVAQALGSYAAALKRSSQPGLRIEFVQLVRTASFQSPQPELRALVLQALEEVWADPGDLLTPATSLIECDPAVRQAMSLARQAGPVLQAAHLAALAGDRLLLCLLQNEIINSIALERLLARVRRQLLGEVLAGAAWPAATAALHAALARQCFINEYVYACDSDDELQQLAALRGAFTTH